MPVHLAYINPLSSYYYFRPYQAFHIREQQTEVTSYGGDPRNPYNNTMFRGMYAELEAAWAEEEAQSGSPFNDEVPERTAPAVEEDAPAPPAPPATPNFSTSNSPMKRLQSVQQQAARSQVTRPAKAPATVASQPRAFKARQ